MARQAWKSGWKIGQCLTLLAASLALMLPPAMQPVQAASSVKKSAAKSGSTRLVKKTIVLKSGKRVTRWVRVKAAPPSPPRLSVAALKGLRGMEDPLELKSSAALVMEDDSANILFAKNQQVSLPVASITKLMTALVVLEAGQPLDETIAITKADLDTEKGTRSHLKFGTLLSRGDLLHLALMASENRAAHALGRNYPGGLTAFVEAMNGKAQLLGMHNSRFVDPTGLSSANMASAEDLARLLRAASANPAIRRYSTDQGYAVTVGRRLVPYRNTNALITNPSWDIVVQKTGYIVEAGQCLVMHAMIEGKSVLIVLLDAVGSRARFADADRIRKWMEAQHFVQEPVPEADASDTQEDDTQDALSGADDQGLAAVSL